MWRHMLRTVPMKISCVCFSVMRPKITNRIKIIGQSGLAMTAANIMFNQISNELLDDSACLDSSLPVTEIDDLQLAADIKLTCAESGEALNNLIKTLHACIQEICDQYQHCIAKQIEITLICMEMDSVGTHWDEITKYRVIADDLRVELIKYRTLINSIGSIVKNEELNTIETHLKEDSFIIQSYHELLDLIEERSNENIYWDKKLLDVHKRSILIAAG